MNIERQVVDKSDRAHHLMLGMRLDYIEVDRFLEDFAGFAEAGASIYCCVPDVHQCVMCHDQPAHRDIVNNADYVVSDSTIMQTARAARHGVPRTNTILGSEMMLELCGEAQRRGIPIALIGGRDDAVLARIREELNRRFPGLEIAFAYSPPFRDLTEAEERDMLLGIADSGARLVFVGLGCPKQERWMSRYRGRIKAAMIGVGAAFDTIGGLVRTSPTFVHRIGLEWLFRLIREPRRLYRRYLVTAPRFLWLLAWDRMKQGSTPRPAD